MHTYFARLAKQSRKTAKYARDIDAFIHYLQYCQKTKLTINYVDGVSKDSTIVDYKNRYSEYYFKQIYARLRNFERVYVNSLKNPVGCYFITLTIPQKDIDVYQGLVNLREYKTKFFHYMRNFRRDCLNKHCNSSIEYIWFIEPHKSGFPHLHMVLFTDIDNFYDLYSSKLRDYWVNVTGGSRRHAFDIRFVSNIYPNFYFFNECESSSATASGVALYSAAVEVGSSTRNRAEDFPGLDSLSSQLHASTPSIQFLVSYIIKYMSKCIFSSIDLPTLIMHSQVHKFYCPNPRFREVVKKSDGSYGRPRSTGSGAYRLWGYSVGLSESLRVRRSGVGSAACAGDPDVVPDALPGAESAEVCSSNTGVGVNVLSVGIGKNTVYESFNGDLLFSLLRRYLNNAPLKEVG